MSLSYCFSCYYKNGIKETQETKQPPIIRVTSPKIEGNV